ncbi:MAG: sigma-70 family RNA polymerase sigma factor, partial [Bacteroidota bacterium]
MLVTDQISGLSDSQLVDKYKSTRDYNYIGILFQRHTQFVYAVSMKYLKDQDKSKDAVMEIFEKLVNDLLRFDIENFKGWLHQVTKNHCLLTLRSEKYQRKFSEKYKKDTMVLMEKPDVLYQEND